MIPIRNGLPNQEQSTIHQLRTDLYEALLEAEAIRKGQQEGTTWQAFLAELDQELVETPVKNDINHYFK